MLEVGCWREHEDNEAAAADDDDDADDDDAADDDDDDDDDDDAAAADDDENDDENDDDDDMMMMMMMMITISQSFGFQLELIWSRISQQSHWTDLTQVKPPTCSTVSLGVARAAAFVEHTQTMSSNEHQIDIEWSVTD